MPVRAWIVVSIGVLVGIVHAGGVTAHFVFDDNASIVKNASIRSLSDVGSVLFPPAKFGGTEEARPLLNLSFAVSYAIHGLSAEGFHFGNLLIHLINTLLLLMLIAEVLPQTALRRDATLLACLAALLWGVHPLTTTVVSYAAQRAESLGALFYLATLCCAVRRMRTPRGGWSLAAIVFSVLGVAAKETVVTAPLAALMIDRAYFAASWNEIWTDRRRMYLGMLASWGLVFGLALAYGARSRTAGTGAGISAWDYGQTQAVALVWYVRQIAWPFALNFDYGSRLITDWSRVGPAAGLLVAAALAIGIGFARRPRLAVPFFLFFLLLAPTSTLLPIVTQTIGEHRLYLPAACLLTGTLAALLAAMPDPRFRRAILAVATVCILAGAAGTVARNRDHSDPLRLWTVTWERCPQNPRAARCVVMERRNSRPDEPITEREVDDLFATSVNDPNLWNRGMARNERGQTWLLLERYDRAAADFESLIELLPGLPEGYNNLGFLYSRLGKHAEAIPLFDAALNRNPSYSLALLNRGNAWRHLGQSDAALGDLGRALEFLPSHVDAYVSRGSTHLDRREWRPAVEDFRRAVALAPEHADARFWLAFSLIEAGAPAEGLPLLASLLPVRDDVDIRLLMARACDRLNDELRATEHLRQAVERSRGTDRRSHLQLARRLIARGDTDESERLLVAAQAGQARPGEVHYLLGMVFYLRNDLDKARSEWISALRHDPSDRAIRQALGRLPEPLRSEEQPPERTTVM